LVHFVAGQINTKPHKAASASKHRDKLWPNIADHSAREIRPLRQNWKRAKCTNVLAQNKMPQPLDDQEACGPPFLIRRGGGQAEHDTQKALEPKSSDLLLDGGAAETSAPDVRLAL
jgi:hypothetical protein